MFTLHKLHPGDTPEQFELEFLVTGLTAWHWGWVDILCIFTASATPAFFSAVTVKVKMPTMETRCVFLQVISKNEAVSHTHTRSFSLSFNPLRY